ncbi:hypothetical protein ABZ858_01775 [Streptomyces sp. NPDC047017]|uniref:hypothetical protein n=1 Tax=Streptomyces sp. NPDC047017 TaxID=3155024 RepID=UPI0033EFEA16
MNTERPENDDAANGPANGDGPAGAARHDSRPAAKAGPAGTGGPAGEGGSGGRRGRRPLVAVSVAAAVLLVGGGGAYLATGAFGGPDGRTESAGSGGRTPPPLVLDGYAVAATGGTGGGNGIAPGEPDPYGAAYRATGTLPAGPASAPVYAARGEVTRAEVARLAKALGVTGTPVADAQAWQVGTGKDGSGPMLRVTRRAPGAWTFSRYAPGTDDCKGVTCGPGSAVPSGQGPAAPSGQDPAAPSGQPVSVAAAERAAAPVLAAVGQSGARLDARQVMGAQRVVEADPVVGGLPTHGWTTGLTVGLRGEVVGGSGQLKAPVKGATYPVLDARRTLDLMNSAPRGDHRMGIGGCPSPVAAKDRLEAPCGRASQGSGGHDTLTVEKAVFGLAAQYSGGRQALVPSWLFQVRAPGGQDSGFTVPYPAVDPRYLSSGTTAPASPAAPATPGASGTAAAKTRDVPVTGYSARGDELTVSFEGGVCADYKVAAKEGAGQVTVTVTETPWRGKVCIMIAEEYRRTLRLGHPLGDRKVIGSGGRAVPGEAAGAGSSESVPLAR